jgi:hypothetical protein
VSRNIAARCLLSGAPPFDEADHLPPGAMLSLGRHFGCRGGKRLDD